MKLEDYKTVLYRQPDDAWVAEIPAIPGLLCSHANARRSAAMSWPNVFQMIADEYREKGIPCPPTPPKSYMPSGTARDFQNVARKLGFYKDSANRQPRALEPS